MTDGLACIVGDGDTPPDTGLAQGAVGQVAGGRAGDRAETSQLPWSVAETGQVAERDGEVDVPGERARLNLGRWSRRRGRGRWGTSLVG
jgi:hypothetical protein